MSAPRTGFQQGQGGAPLDRRYVRSVYRNGQQVANAVIAGGNETLTSTGAFGPYSIAFDPVIFSNAPSVTASAGVSSGGDFVLIDVTGVTTIGFTYSVARFTPGLVVLPAAMTVLVEWLAIGS